MMHLSNFKNYSIGFFLFVLAFLVYGALSIVSFGAFGFRKNMICLVEMFDVYIPIYDETTWALRE